MRLVGSSCRIEKNAAQGPGPSVGTRARGGKEAGPFGLRGGATGILERVLVPGDVAAVTWRGSAGVLGRDIFVRLAIASTFTLGGAPVTYLSDLEYI